MSKGQVTRWLGGAFSIFMVMSTYAQTDFDREQLQQRISPVGRVHVEIPQETAHLASPQPTQTQPVAKMSPGQATYEHHCIVCHRDGVAGAPKFRNADDWNARLVKQNIDSLTATAMKGLNAMPIKGTCQECTEADVKAAIEYMVPQ